MIIVEVGLEWLTVELKRGCRNMVFSQGEKEPFFPSPLVGEGGRRPVEGVRWLLPGPAPQPPLRGIFSLEEGTVVSVSFGPCMQRDRKLLQERYRATASTPD